MSHKKKIIFNVKHNPNCIKKYNKKSYKINCEEIRKEDPFDYENNRDGGPNEDKNYH
jgi:hypothetical protein